MSYSLISVIPHVAWEWVIEEILNNTSELVNRYELSMLLLILITIIIRIEIYYSLLQNTDLPAESPR